VGSRIMHLIIANIITDRLKIEDRTPFLLGSIAPDAVATKNESHFFMGEHQDYSRSVDYKGFLNKYSSQAESLYILGSLYVINQALVTQLSQSQNQLEPM
jgi:hypothetical protein